MKKRVLIINIINFFPKKHYPKKEWDKVRGENCSYLKEKKLLRAQSYKASVCTNFDE